VDMGISFFLFWVMVGMAALIWFWEIGARLLFGDPRPKPKISRDLRICAKSGCRSVNPPHARFCGRCGIRLR